MPQKKTVSRNKINNVLYHTVKRVILLQKCASTFFTFACAYFELCKLINID